jgi:hypothetical protein
MFNGARQGSLTAEKLKIFYVSYNNSVRASHIQNNATKKKQPFNAG